MRLDLSTDWRVMIFTAAVAMMKIIFGLRPPGAPRIEAGAAMKAAGNDRTRGSHSSECS